MSPNRPTALLTGVGRRNAIGAAIALGLAQDGWNLAINYWAPYDDRLGLPKGANDPGLIANECRELGADVVLVEGDLADPETPDRLIADAEARLGPVTGLVMSHCESVDSAILTTTVESWDKHYAVNVRAPWLLIKALAERLQKAEPGVVGARIVALTSDHAAFNLPYGSSKAALDRLVIAAATELADFGVRANLINPGPVDTGWMDEELRQACIEQTAAGRLGTPNDVARLVRFLFSDAGSWMNGQLLYSNGGFHIA